VPRILRFKAVLATLWERKGPQDSSLALSIVGGIACERNRIETDTKGMDLPISTQLIKLKLTSTKGMDLPISTQLIKLKLTLHI
jgi:hypothetical protein